MRVALTVIVDTDNMPGAMHTAESVKIVVESILLTHVGHYNPVVILNK